MFPEQGLDHLPLDPLTAPMNHPDLVKSCLAALLEILLYNTVDISRRKGMQIDIVFDGKDDCLIKVDIARFVFQWLFGVTVNGNCS